MTTVQILLIAVIAVAVAGASGKKNVLLILVDDLRPQMNAYGHSFMHTPHFDRLANTGLMFNRAYITYSYCSPSRNSFMTGRWPDRTQVYNFIDDFREAGVGANWTSMPQHFKNNGYLTMGAGKTYHVGHPAAFDTPYSWSEEFPYVSADQCDNASRTSPYVNCTTGTGECEDKHAILFEDQIGSSWCVYNETKLKYPLYDRVTARTTVQNLELAVQRKQNFFIAAGFHRPHIPWAVPQQFWDLYPDAGDLPGPKHPNVTVDAPMVAWHTGLEGNSYNVSVPEQNAQKLRKAYYAATSYTDSLVGQILDKLDELKLTNDTVVAMWGDHGWQLGEANLWKKMTNYERGTRVPMFIRAPHKPNAIGKKTSALASSVDMYRTLASLAGLPNPEASVQGQDLSAVLDDPPSIGVGPRDYAFSQFAKQRISTGAPIGVCTQCTRQEIDFMGYAVRDDVYRYVLWVQWNKHTLRPIWDQIEGEELYDHTNDMGDDFDAFENVNIVYHDTYQSERERLKAVVIDHYSNDY
eukprot:TRINITY_DN7503_c0_g2_i2.p1 TRINITY_DN7503_c0_g2~~TRINITY_DN7503_c0_g2_i2.p1  ORF type:complete len:523 (+),score=108.88 TRINITY_DN7503_c0_g2_i2:17-1585(+)